MSLLRWATVVFFGVTSWSLLANPLSSAAGSAMTPAMQMDISDTKFCREIRSRRESFLAQEPDLNKSQNSPEYSLNSARCFSPAENLFYAAHQEAQKVLGSHAPWYIKISEDFRDRVISVCEGMELKNESADKAYNHCVENRHNELMGPYEAKYQREAKAYVKRRKEIALKLTESCDMAISTKRNQLPREIEFPIAYHDDLSHSIPSWLIEKNINDVDWLEKLNRPKVNELMRDVLEEDCPGDMVYWVVYKKPAY